MFWDYFRGFRKYPESLPDVLPWATLVDKGTILCKDESLLSTWALEAVDQDSWSPYDQGRLLSRLNLAWTHLEANWGVWMDLWRHPSVFPPPRRISHRLASLLERNHRQTYDPQLWSQSIYLSLWHGSLSTTQEVMNHLWLPMMDASAMHSLDAFHDSCHGVIDVLKGGTRTLVPLTDDAWATYLHGLISDDRSLVRMPEYPTGLDYAFADCDLLPGWYPKLMRDEETGIYLGLVTLKSFPASMHTNFLKGLWSLPFFFRLVSRWLPQNLEQMESQLTKRQKNLTAKGYGLREAVMEWATSHPSKMKNRYLEDQVDDTDAARFELKKEDVAFGDMSLTVVLMDADQNVLKSQRREVERVLRMTGLVTRREWVNPVGGWLGTLPGVALSNPRRWRLSTTNWLTLGAWQSPSIGKPTTLSTARLPALTLAKTLGCNPYWLSLFSGDVGHTLVSGPTGSGKSTLMKWLAAQWFAYEQSGPPQLFWFDYKRSARLFILCMGGKYHDLGQDTINFQPLRDVHDLHARAAAFTWMCDRVKESHDVLTGIMEEHLQVSLEIIAQVPQSTRTLTEWMLVSSAQSTKAQRHIPPGSVHPDTGARDYSRRDKVLDDHKTLRRVLKPFTRGEIYGHLFDADHDDLDEGTIHAFERESLLMKTPQLLAAAESHIWSRLYPRLTGVPTLIPMDEMGESLKYPEVREWVDRGLRMLREKLAVLMLATQNHLDFSDSEIGPMLRLCPHQMFLPDPNAISGGDDPKGPLRSYQAMGLGVDEIRQWIAGGIPKQDVYDVSPEARRLIHLPMSPLASVVCAPSSPEVHAQIDVLLAREGAEGFPSAWLREHGHAQEAQELCHGS